MTHNLPFVSIILPCYNEGNFIASCLNSIITNEYPKNNLEILVIDGKSADNTRLVVKKIAEFYPFIQLIENSKRITPSALNIGIKKAKGNIIMRMDAHAIYDKHYISRCIKYLVSYNADNVGGTLITCPQNDTFVGRAISSALAHRFGVGNSRFRIGATNPQWVDTVFCGCYRKKIFDTIGLFNENLVKGQDLEFNLRLKKTGGKILLHPKIISYYYARSVLNWTFIKFYFWEGFWAVYPARFVGKNFISLQRLIPCVFVSVMFLTYILSMFTSTFSMFNKTILGSYIVANVLVSFSIAISKKNIRYIVILPIIFTAIHIPYGCGSLYAFFKLLRSKI